MRNLWKNYSLAIVLSSLFLASWVGQFFFQAMEVTNQAAEHGQSFDWSDFFIEFGRATFENWQSEFLQLLSFVVLTTYFIYKGSHESRDSQDRMEAKIDRILEATTGEAESR